MSNSGLAPMCAISRWPSAMRCSVASRATRDVVDGEGRQPRVRSADRDHRQVELEQAIGLGVAELDRDRDDAVDALAAQERLEDVSRSVAIGGEAVQRDVVAATHEGRRDAAEHRAEEPAVEERHEHADVARAAGGEARRRRRDDVAEGLRRRLDARAGRIGHVAAPAERARDGGRRDARVRRDLIDADHVVTSFARPRSARLSRPRARPSCRRAVRRRSIGPLAAITIPSGSAIGAEPDVRDDGHIPVAECHDVPAGKPVEPRRACPLRAPCSRRGREQRAVERERRRRVVDLRVAGERRPLAGLRQPGGAGRAEPVRRSRRRSTGAARGSRRGRSARRSCGTTSGPGARRRRGRSTSGRPSSSPW